jgi:hypothetical protein
MSPSFPGADLLMSARLVSRRLPIRGRSGRSNRRNEEIDERFRSRIRGRGSASCRTTIGHKSCYLAFMLAATVEDCHDPDEKREAIAFGA